MRRQELWATHLGPELGGQGYGQLKLCAAQRDPRPLAVGADRLRLPGARHRQRRDHRPLRHARAEGALPAAAARRRDLLLLLDDRAPRRRRPDDVHDPRRQGRRRVGHQRLEVLLVERQDRVVPHRHGGDQPRRERRTRACRCSWSRPTRRASNIVRNVGLGGEPLGEGSHALIHYDDVRVPGRRAARRRGPGVRHRPDPARRRPHPPRHAHHRPGPEGARHDVRAGPQPRDAGQPAGRQAVRAGLHRRLVRPARRSSGCSCCTRRGRSTSTTTTARSARTSPR